MSTKAATTSRQQVALIKQKGFIVEDDFQCEEFFNRHNYYRVSAYLLPYKTANGYVPGIPFSRIQSIYAFDSKLRNWITGVIEQIENYCRTLFSRVHVQFYGPLGYMSSTAFSSVHRHADFLKNIHEYIRRNGKSPVVVHHQVQYSGDFPLWVIIEFFSIGALSYFYSDLKSPEQKAIASVHGTSVPCLKSWMRCVTDLRNRCAHYSRLYYWVFPAVPKMPKSVQYSSDHSLFSQLLMLSFLYPDNAEWNSVALGELENLLKEFYNDIRLIDIGFPSNWKQLLTR